MRLIKPMHQILTAIDRSRILISIEAAGRTCYKSEKNMTIDSASSFVKSIIRRGHESVIEHENISVRFICDRGVTHELVRHRLAAYSQESTRYCNYSGGVTFIIPPWLNLWEGEYLLDDVEKLATKYSSSCYYWAMHMLCAERDYLNLLRHDWTPQEARSVLPNSLKTEIVMTANLREWRHIFKLRCAEAAHPQMRQIMMPLHQDLSRCLPEIFGGIA